jgi:hypothetical protein
MNRRPLTPASHLAFACWFAAAAAAAADPPCTTEAREKWLAQAEVRERIKRLGYRIVDLEIENGCYAIEVRDKRGREIDLYVDPMTARIVREEQG